MVKSSFEEYCARPNDSITFFKQNLSVENILLKASNLNEEFLLNQVDLGRKTGEFITNFYTELGFYNRDTSEIQTKDIVSKILNYQVKERAKLDYYMLM